MEGSAGKGSTASSRAAEKLSFDRKRFAPYLSKFKSDEEIEDLFEFSGSAPDEARLTL